MYLQQVFRYNKWLFALCIVFAAGQLFINIKRGMVLSPFYHYGMYSEVIRVKPSYQVFQVVVNGIPLQGSHFTPWQWDRILWPVVYYSQVNKSNALYTTDVKRLLQSIHLQPEDKHFLAACNYTQFEGWYKNFLSRLTNQQVSTIEVNLRQHSLVTSKLQPGTPTLSLQDLCR